MALIDKASLLFVPSVVAEGKAFNVLPSGNRAPDNKGGAGYDQTRADFDFDRGSNTAATRIGSDGLLKKYRENLLTYSNVFSNGVWAKSNLSVASSNGAWEVTDNTTSGSHYLYWGGTTPSSSVLTLSVEAKAGSVNYLVMRLGGFTYAYFNLSNGTLGAIHPSFIDAKIEETSDGFYRCSATILTPSSGNASVFYPSDNSSNVSYTGTGAVAITIKNAQLETGLVATDVLTSGATTGKAGVLVDLPRINYDANGENGALLLEPSRQQLFQYSEYLSTFGGTATINDNAIISPEGLQNAAEVVLSASGTDSFYKEVAVTANTQYTLSFYVKQGSNTNNQLAVRDQTNSTFIATDVSYTASSTEWKRIEYTFTTPAGCVEARIYPHRSSLSSIGNGYFYGLQVEAGSYSTSYIPNHGTSGGVTRAADSCSVTGASDVIGQTEGTLFMDVNLSARDSFTYFVIAPNLATTSAYIGIGITVTAFSFEVLNSGIQVAYNYSNSSTGNFKIAFAYKANDFVAYVNGTQVMTDTSGSVPACSQIGLNNYDKDQPLLYKQAVLFNERLTNEELATLTTL